MRYLLFLMLPFVLACATAQKMVLLEMGMTKMDVIAVMDQPNYTSAIKGEDGVLTEYWIYSLYSDPDNTFSGKKHDYFIRFRDGVVNAYGRQGDFDSTKPFETKSTIDLNIK